MSDRRPTRRISEGGTAMSRAFVKLQIKFELVVAVAVQLSWDDEDVA